MPPPRHRPFVPLALAACAVAVLLPARTAGDDARERPHRVSVCYAPGTPLDGRSTTFVLDGAAGKTAVAQYQADDDARWSRTAVDGSLLTRGRPTTLTWAVVPDGTSIPGYLGEVSSPSNLRAWLNGIYGNESVWMPLLERVFERWSEVSGVTYVHETNDDGATLGTQRGVSGVRADIRIGGHAIDGRNGTLAYNFFPDDGDMVIDTADRYFDNTAGESLRLRNVVAHEHGHGLGFDHVCPVDGTKLMEPTSSTSLDGPQLDDVLAAQRLYGDRFEDNGTPGAATDVGSAAGSGVLVETVSIDGADDVDVYAFTAPAGTRVDVTLTPVGRTYAQAPQNPDGGCTSGNSYDTLRRSDLSVEVLAPNGTQRLAFADAAPEGATEEIVGIEVGSTSPHFVRVRGDSDAVQLYKLAIRVENPGERPTAVDDKATTAGAVPARIDVLANDTGLDGAQVSVSLATAPANGAAVLTDDATVRYVPRRGFTGKDVFTYRLRDAAGVTSTATVEVTVEAALYAGNARFDTDGDLFPDELEAAVGTSSVSSISRPAADALATLAPIKVRALQRFRKTGKDEALLRGTLDLPLDAALDGLVAQVYVGGVTRRFVLDRKGRGKDGSDRLRVARTSRGDAQLRLRLRRADLSAAWADEGLSDDTNVRDEYRELTVFVVAAGRASRVNLPLSFTIRRGKGRAKLAD